MEQFRGLVNAHLARMVEAVARHTFNKGPDFRQKTAEQALLYMWNARDLFDPKIVPWMTFFEAGVEWSVGRVRQDHGLPDPEGLLAFLNAEDETPDPIGAYRNRLEMAETEPSPGERFEAVAELDFSQGSGPEEGLTAAGECPPCWRCRYFDGWLPTRKVAMAANVDPDIQESMRRLDENKVRIAHWVRSKGWEDMEGNS